MTPLSPTPLTPRCKECGTALELPGVAAELERLERALAERDAQLGAEKICAVAWEAGAKELQSRLAAAEARNTELVGALEKHGKHAAGCYDKRQIVPRCVCGLNAALADAVRKKEGG